METLETMSTTQFLYRLALSMLAAMVIIGITAEIIGEERKALWFKKRTKFSFFLRRGPLGEKFHFGYPRTLEGIGVFLVMMAAIALACVFLFTTPLLN
ncbi:MAG: hypothetical protein MR209_00295 [Veillonellaceae bacterium]|nr:hypothetical protein [Veillonellaceae bacterium]